MENRIHRTIETIGLIKVKTYAAIKLSQKIAVGNGILDVETGKIEDFKHTDFITNRILADYKPEAKSQPFLDFIEQVCPNDKELLQEWSGYLLLKDYRYHAIMWFYGPTGRNGKGVWARTMESILGEENYTSVSIDEFDGKHRFSLYKLYGSLFNICSEPRTDRPLTIELLQALSGQDAIDAEKKGIQATLKFKNTAKVTVMGNKFPPVKTPTEAFWDRLKLCNFPNRFIGKDQIPNIEKAWLDDPEQRSGILNWMLEGLQRLIRNGQFTLTKSQEETVIQFKRASDSIGAWQAEMVEYDTKKFSKRIDTFDHYKAYCDYIGIPAENDKTFCARLKNIPKIKDTSTRMENKKVRVWAGILLKPIPQDEDQLEETFEQKILDTSGTLGTLGTPPITPCKLNTNNSNYIQDKRPVPSVPSVPETYKNRFCKDECFNFRKASCSSPNGMYRSETAEVPLNCPGYKYVESVGYPSFPEPGEG